MLAILKTRYQQLILLLANLSEFHKSLQHTNFKGVRKIGERIAVNHNGSA